MKKMVTTSLLALGFVSATVQAGSVVESGYARDARDVVVKSGAGLCWRTDRQTSSTAETGCPSEPAAPPQVVATAPVAVPADVPEKKLKLITELAKPAAPPACELTYTLGNGETFAFDGAALTRVAKSAIDRDVIARLADCDRGTPIRVSGRTDYLGSQQYNLKLSAKRAKAVADYLMASGVAASRIEAVALGESAPVQTCDRKLNRTQLIACLAPDRSTEIKVGRR